MSKTTKGRRYSHVNKRKRKDDQTTQDPRSMLMTRQCTQRTQCYHDLSYSMKRENMPRESNGGSSWSWQSNSSHRLFPYVILVTPLIPTVAAPGQKMVSAVQLKVLWVRMTMQSLSEEDLGVCFLPHIKRFYRMRKRKGGIRRDLMQSCGLWGTAIGWRHPIHGNRAD